MLPIQPLGHGASPVATISSAGDEKAQCATFTGSRNRLSRDSNETFSAAAVFTSEQCCHYLLPLLRHIIPCLLGSQHQALRRDITKWVRYGQHSALQKMMSQYPVNLRVLINGKQWPLAGKSGTRQLGTSYVSSWALADEMTLLPLYRTSSGLQSLKVVPPPGLSLLPEDIHSIIVLADCQKLTSSNRVVAVFSPSLDPSVSTKEAASLSGQRSRRRSKPAANRIFPSGDGSFLLHQVRFCCNGAIEAARG